MPVEPCINIKSISEEEFHTLDYEVMGLAFSIHHELGRLWNEKIYQNELANRCLNTGFKNVQTEVGIDVSFQDFKKTFYIDLILNNSVSMN